MIADRTRSHHAFSAPEMAHGGAHGMLINLWSLVFCYM